MKELINSNHKPKSNFFAAPPSRQQETERKRRRRSSSNQSSTTLQAKVQMASQASSTGNQSPLYSLLIAPGKPLGGERKPLLFPLLTNSEIPERFERYNSLEASKSPKLTRSLNENSTPTSLPASNHKTHHFSESSPSSANFISRIPVYSPTPARRKTSQLTSPSTESKIPVFHENLRRAHSSKATPKPQISIVKRTASSRNYYNYPQPEEVPKNKIPISGQPVQENKSKLPRHSIFLHSPQSLGSKIPSKSVLNIQKLDYLQNILSSQSSLEGSQVFGFEKRGLANKAKSRTKVVADSDESDGPKSSSSDSDSSGSSLALTSAFESSDFTTLFSNQLSPHALEKKKMASSEVNGKSEVLVQQKVPEPNQTVFEKADADAIAAPNFESITKNIENLEAMAKLDDTKNQANLKPSRSEEEFSIMEQLLDKDDQSKPDNKTPSSSSSLSSLSSSKSSLNAEEDKIDYPEIFPIPGSVDLGAIADKILIPAQKSPSVYENLKEKLPEGEVKETVISTTELKSIQPSPKAQKALVQSKKLSLTIEKPKNEETINLKEIADKIMPSGSLSPEPKPTIFLDPPQSPPLSPHLVAKPPLPPPSLSPLKGRQLLNRPGNLNLAQLNSPNAPPSTPVDSSPLSNNSKTTPTSSQSLARKLIITTESYTRQVYKSSSPFSPSPFSTNGSKHTSSSSSSVDNTDSKDNLSPCGTLKRFHVTSSPVSETRKFFPENLPVPETSNQLSTPSSPVAVVTPTSFASDVASINSNIEQIAVTSFDLQSQHAYMPDVPQPSTSKFPVSETSKNTPAKPVNDNPKTEITTKETGATKKKSKWKRFVKKLKFWKHESKEH